ncbi:MAG: hypothetical protein RPU61_07060 [Candidatus Sedimenticola sp. (ex Thyasira tokunagai)]
MPTFESSEIISFLAMLVSLTAVIVGPIVTFKVAKRQIVSPIRQKWIDELRELISEYLSECEKLLVLGEDGILNKEETDEKIFTRLLYLEQKLKLMLNPNEERHIELLKIVKEITEEIHHGVGNIIDFGGKLKGATEVSQKILKEEWVRVKSGDI